MPVGTDGLSLSQNAIVVVGSRTDGYCLARGSVGVVDVVGFGVGQVTQRAFDGESEQVADAADVAAGGSCFVEDPVFAHEVDGDAGEEPGQ